MREIRLSGSVEGVMGNHDLYSDCAVTSIDSRPTLQRRVVLTSVPRRSL